MSDCRPSQMLAVYAGAGQARTPTPLRQALARMRRSHAEAAGSSAAEEEGTPRTGGHAWEGGQRMGEVQCSQYDMSDSFIATGEAAVPLSYNARLCHSYAVACSNHALARLWPETCQEKYKFYMPSSLTGHVSASCVHSESRHTCYHRRHLD